MRKINYQQGFMAVMAAVLVTLMFVSCDGISKKRASRNWSKEVVHEFPNSNWAFEEEVLEFPFDIEDTTQSYDVAVVLVYDTTVATLQDIPLSLTLSAPDGMKSFSTSHFMLNRKDNPDIKVTGNTGEVSVLVYPHRKFKTPGTYTLTIYRRAEKADNYGFLSLATKVKIAK